MPQKYFKPRNHAGVKYLYDSLQPDGTKDMRSRIREEFLRSQFQRDAVQEIEKAVVKEFEDKPALREIIAPDGDVDVTKIRRLLMSRLTADMSRGAIGGPIVEFFKMNRGHLLKIIESDIRRFLKKS